MPESLVKTHVAQKIHANAIYDLEKHCYPHEFLTQQQIEKHVLRMNSDGFVVLDRADRVIAYTLFDNNTDFIEIVRLGVHPYHRRCGHAKSLLNRLKAKLTEHKQKLIIHVPDYLIDGQIFLRSQGAIASSIEKRHFRKHMTDSYMFVFLKEWDYIDGHGVLTEEDIVPSGV